MIRFLLLLVALFIVVGIVIALIIAALVTLTVALAIGVPLYFISRRWLHLKGIGGIARSPVERVRNLYLDGKIDLFEFERRVAHLISLEH